VLVLERERAGNKGFFFCFSHVSPTRRQRRRRQTTNGRTNACPRRNTASRPHLRVHGAKDRETKVLEPSTAAEKRWSEVKGARRERREKKKRKVESATKVFGGERRLFFFVFFIFPSSLFKLESFTSRCFVFRSLASSSLSLSLLAAEDRAALLPYLLVLLAE
jgi:hypothetical protein